MTGHDAHSDPTAGASLEAGTSRKPWQTPVVIVSQARRDTEAKFLQYSASGDVKTRFSSTSTPS